MKVAHVLLAVLVAAIWGFNFVVIRVGLDAMPPILFAGLRFALAAVPALWIARPAVPWPRLIAIAGFLFVIQFAGLFSAMAIGMPPGVGSVTLQAQALFTTLFAGLLLREWPRPVQAVGLFIALCGLALIGATAGSGGITWPGLMLTLVAAAGWGMGNVLLRGTKADLLPLMVWLSLLSAPPLLLGSWAIEGTDVAIHALRAMSWLAFGALGYIAIISTLLGYVIWGHLLRQYPATTVAPFSLLVPFFGAGASAILLGETFTPLRIAGFVLILAGVAIVARPPSANDVR